MSTRDDREHTTEYDPRADYLRAVDSGDPNEIVLSVIRASQVFDREGYPEDWPTWERTFESALDGVRAKVKIWELNEEMGR